jgi:ATP-binding cassette, subfamily B, bacterial
LDRPFGSGQTLSGGQRKLLALSRCLLRSPTFLFLDEPTTGMDNLEKLSLVEGLRNACRGKTAIVVDHDILWLRRFCDYFVVLEGGKVAQRGTAEELLAAEGPFRTLYESGQGVQNPMPGTS